MFVFRHLITCLVDSGETNEAAHFARVTETFIKSHVPRRFPRLFMLLVNVVFMNTLGILWATTTALKALKSTFDRFFFNYMRSRFHSILSTETCVVITEPCLSTPCGRAWLRVILPVLAFSYQSAGLLPASVRLLAQHLAVAAAHLLCWLAFSRVASATCFCPRSSLILMCSRPGPSTGGAFISCGDFPTWIYCWTCLRALLPTQAYAYIYMHIYCNRSSGAPVWGSAVVPRTS